MRYKTLQLAHPILVHPGGMKRFTPEIELRLALRDVAAILKCLEQFESA